MHRDQTSLSPSLSMQRLPPNSARSPEGSHAQMAHANANANANTNTNTNTSAAHVTGNHHQHHPQRLAPSGTGFFPLPVFFVSDCLSLFILSLQETRYMRTTPILTLILNSAWPARMSALEQALDPRGRTTMTMITITTTTTSMTRRRDSEARIPVCMGATTILAITGRISWTTFSVI